MLTVGLYFTAGLFGTTGNTLFFREEVFLHCADGTAEAFREILPGRSGGDAAFGVAFFGVIFPTAYVANIFHRSFLL